MQSSAQAPIPALSLKHATVYRCLLWILPLGIFCLLVLYSGTIGPGRPTYRLLAKTFPRSTFIARKLANPAEIPVDWSSYYIGAAAIGWGLPDCLYSIPPEEVSNPTELQLSPSLAPDTSNHFLPFREYVAPDLCAPLLEHGVVRSFVFNNPPPLAFLTAPLAWLDFIPALRVWFLLLVGSLALTAWVFLLECRRYGFNPWLSALATCYVFLVSAPMLGGANMNQLVIAAVALFVLAVQRNQAPGEAASALFLAAGKAYAVVWVPLWLIYRRRRAIFWGLGLVHSTS